MNETIARNRLAEFGQEHLLAFWDELTDDQRRGLAEQIAASISRRIAELIEKQHQPADFAALAARAEPPPAFRLGASDNRISAAEARAAAIAAFERGEVGAILVAGGQGTRLGFPHPKGMFPIGPVSRAPLFQILFEKVLALGRRYGPPVPLYLMTSPATHDETVAYLEREAADSAWPPTMCIFSAKAKCRLSKSTPDACCSTIKRSIGAEPGRPRRDARGAGQKRRLGRHGSPRIATRPLFPGR